MGKWEIIDHLKTWAVGFAGLFVIVVVYPLAVGGVLWLIDPPSEGLGFGKFYAVSFLGASILACAMFFLTVIVMNLGAWLRPKIRQLMERFTS